MTNSRDIKPGQTIRYTLWGVTVTKKVTTRNVHDIMRVINMREIDFTILPK